jgi:N-alpha-acetyltransferase 40
LGWIRYLSSEIGYDEKEKRVELFDLTSRFLLLTVDERLVGFAMFRFDWEEDINEKDVEVLYLWVDWISRSFGDLIDDGFSYEIQIESDWRAKGLGRIIVEMLRVLGVETCMRKIMLTVFKGENQDLTTLTFPHPVTFW